MFLGGGAKHMPALERWNLRYLVQKAGFGPKYQLGYAEFVRHRGEPKVSRNSAILLSNFLPQILRAWLMSTASRVNQVRSLNLETV